MRKVIEKSSEIKNSDLVDWKNILESIDFPKEHINFGVEYCDFHAKKEFADEFNCIHGNPKDCSLLPLSLHILKLLNLNEVKEYAIAENDITIQKVCKAHMNDTNSTLHEFVATDVIVNCVEDILCNAIAQEINNAIANSEKKILNIGLLAQTIQVTSEKTIPPVITITSNYSVQ